MDKPLDVSHLPMGDPHPCDLVKAGCDPITGKPAPPQQAIAKLRVLDAAGEDPRNANQRWDVTPEQAGALLAHLDDVEQRRAEGGAVLTRERLERLLARVRKTPLPETADALAAHIALLEQRHAAAVAALRKYGVHSKGCAFLAEIGSRFIYVCDCGLNAALAPAQEASDGK